MPAMATPEPKQPTRPEGATPSNCRGLRGSTCSSKGDTRGRITMGSTDSAASTPASMNGAVSPNWVISPRPAWAMTPAP